MTLEEQQELIKDFEAAVGGRLKAGWNYKTNADCELLPEMFIDQNYQAMAEEFRKRVQGAH